MHAKRFFISCAAAATLSGMLAPAHAEDIPGTVPEASPQTSPQKFPGSKISFAPLPLEIYMQPGERPAVVFSTPCIQIEKMTNGFPPILAFENFMLTMIGKVNDSELLPIRLEPVCI